MSYKVKFFSSHVDFFCRTYHDVALAPTLTFKSKLKSLFQAIFLLSLVVISGFTCVVKINKTISVVNLNTTLS